MASKLLGAFRAPTAATVRLSYGGSHSDWVVAAGTSYASHEALLAAWSAQVLHDLGAGFAFALASDGAGGAKVTLTTPANIVTIYWSQTGDGTAIRDYLGDTGDGSGHSSGVVWPNPIQAGLYPTLGFGGLTRSSSSRQRAYMGRLDGSVQAQHRRAPGDADAAEWSVRLQLQTADELAALEQFAADLRLDVVAGRLSVVHTGYTTISGYLPGEDLALRIVRAREGWDGLWYCDLQVRSL